MVDVKYVCLAEIRELLEKESKKRELAPEQKGALVHAQRFARISAQEGRNLIEELKKNNVSEPIACKIADMLPTHPDDVRLLFSKSDMISSEKIDKILEIVRKYIPVGE